MALKTIRPRLATLDTRTCKPPPKQADAELQTPAHRAWAEEVKRRAGYRCEWVENGERCLKTAPAHRMFADHVEERRDGGAKLDSRNGRCLCGQHHSLKTAKARAERMAL